MRDSIKFFPAILIIGALILAISSYWDESLIVDEIPHVGAGYSYVVKGDMRLNPEHPPLVKDLAGLAMLPLGLNQDAFDSIHWTRNTNDQWTFGRLLIYNTGNDADAITFWARLPMLVFFLLSALFIFKWSKKLFGQIGAIIALILFAFSPTVLAHARFVTTDSAALFGVLFATYYFIAYLKKQDTRNMLIAALAFGIALLTKFSTFLLVPFFLILAVAYGLTERGMKFKKNLVHAFRDAGKAILIFAVGFVFITWPVYYLNIMNYPPDRQRADTSHILATFGNRTLADPVVWMSDKPVLRAAGQYLLGLLMVVQRSAGGNTTYFLGEVTNTGWWYYFPIVYFMKEPLAWWILVFVALMGATYAVSRTKPSAKTVEHWVRGHFAEFAMLLWLAIYWTTSIRSTLNIGVRHLLPTYPFVIMLVAGQIAALVKRLEHFSIEKFKAFGALVAILMGWYVFENIRAYPYYLTYFNQVAGGPSGGYQYVTDSNLDWGQDLKRLGQWVKENNIKKIELDYFGWAEQSYYLKDRFIWGNSRKYRDAYDFIKRNESDGWIAVSATFLQGSIGLKTNPALINYTWLKAYEPVTVIGNSIFVWRITK